MLKNEPSAGHPPARSGAGLENREGTRILFVSGLSGSGKSTAMAALGDLSFHCVDNLPPQLIEPFLDLCAAAKPPIARIGLAIDSREGSALCVWSSAGPE